MGKCHSKNTNKSIFVPIVPEDIAKKIVEDSSNYSKLCKHDIFWTLCDHNYYNDYIYNISRFTDLILKIVNPINCSNI